MRFASLGSGSGGNATLVDTGSGMLMIDCGFALREVLRRMDQRGLDPAQLVAILVTHEHGDHSKGVGPLSRKYALPVYMTHGTFHGRNWGALPELRLIRGYQSFVIGETLINPVPVPHDAREPAQFTFTRAGKKLGVLTDLGSITPHVVEAYRGCDGLLVEANHDVQMLREGPYPLSLQERVASNWGHLNNAQTLSFLTSLDLDCQQKIMVGHISQKNNSLERAKAALAPILAISNHINFACQDYGFDWVDL